MTELQNKYEPKDLQVMAHKFRKKTLQMVMISKEGHLGSAFSCMEILTVLYFNVMKINPADPNWENRDIFILSKGHACYALYVVLAYRNFFSKKQLTPPNMDQWIFAGHPSKGDLPGIEVSTGSLGHGLSIGVGMALAKKQDNKKEKIFVLLGDGECQEGSIWEGAMLAAAQKLGNLTVIIDANSLQALGETGEILPVESLADKWKAFGWQTCEVDGHDCGSILNTFSKFSENTASPVAIIAKTVKGKGVSYMEGVPMWHARVPAPSEYDRAVNEINSAMKKE